MRNRRLQTRVTTGHFTLPVTIFLSISIWIGTAFLLPSITIERSGCFLCDLLVGLKISGGLESVLSFFLYATIGYLLIELNNIYAMIRMRASVQTAVYFMLISICPAMHYLYVGNIASVALLISLFFLFRGYQYSRPATALFYSFLFIALGSLFFPQLMFFIPVFWIGAYNIQSLTLKSFMASLIGWSVPYWFLLGHAYFYNEMDLFYQPFISLATFGSMDLLACPLWELATFGYLAILFLVSSIHCLVSSYDDKIRTRIYLRFLIFLDFCFFAYFLLQPSLGIQLLPLLLIGTSILIGHLFVLTNSRTSNVFFIAVLLGLLTLFSFNVWTLLYNF